MAKTINVSGRSIEISHPDKVFFPKAGFTKGNIADYYQRIAPTMLPYLQGRPLSMQRFPDGIKGSGFYQKERPDYFPDWIASAQIEVKEDDSRQEQVVCNDAASLVYLADQGVITPHRWLSHADQIKKPDLLIFDLDPPEGDFEAVRFAARRLHDLLDEIEMESFVMTTGSQGLHVVTPLKPKATFDETRQFARNLGEQLAQRYPDRLTLETRKDERKGRLFLDYLRNAYGQTAVTPYALRPITGAPIATPLSWDELDDGDLGSQSYTLDNIFRRLGHKDDPWKEMPRSAVDLENARHRLSDHA
jgi:bifunctional non-homologous end joining protein LigD